MVKVSVERDTNGSNGSIGKLQNVSEMQVLL